MKISDFKLLIQSYKAMSHYYTTMADSIDDLATLIGVNLYWEGILSHPYRLSSFTYHKKTIRNKVKHPIALSELGLDIKEGLLYE